MQSGRRDGADASPPPQLPKSLHSLLKVSSIQLCLHIPHTVLPPEPRRFFILTIISSFAQDIPSIPTFGSQERAVWPNLAGWYVSSCHAQIRKLTIFQEEQWDIYYQWANHLSQRSLTHSAIGCFTAVSIPTATITKTVSFRTQRAR